MATEQSTVDRGGSGQANMVNHYQATCFIQQDSPLLKLPAELRDDIYQRVMWTNKAAVTLDELKRIPKALLHVSRQIRHEASPIYYGRTLKGLVDCSDPKQPTILWLHRIGKANCVLIQRLELESFDGPFSSGHYYGAYFGALSEGRILRLARLFAEALFSTGVELDKVVCLWSKEDSKSRHRLLWVIKVEEELRKLSGTKVKVHERRDFADDHE